MINKLELLINDLVLIFIFIIISIFYYNLNNNSTDHNIITSYYGDNTNNPNSGIAYMVETNGYSGIYEQSSNTNWPSVSEYRYNSSKSACENGSTLLFNSTSNQITVNSNKTDKCYIYFDKRPTTLSTRAIFDNDDPKISSKGTPNFNSNSGTDEGMYSAQDDYGTSYYFRGAVSDNWVKFAGFYWRIIRVTGNNSTKLLFSGSTAPTSSSAVHIQGTTTSIGSYAYNSTWTDNMYAGYMYTSGTVHGLTNSSTAKTTLESWYYNNLISYQNYIDDIIYCNDRSPSTSETTSNGSGGTGTTITYYGYYIRNINKLSPTLICPTKSDAFTVDDEINGNGALTYPIGLITADEGWMAGEGFGVGSIENYLNFGINLMTMTPYGYVYSTEYALKVIQINGYNGGMLDLQYTGFNEYINPVISLKSTVSATGSGTWNDPYIVQ